MSRYFDRCFWQLQFSLLKYGPSRQVNANIGLFQYPYKQPLLTFFWWGHFLANIAAQLLIVKRPDNLSHHQSSLLPFLNGGFQELQVNWQADATESRWFNNLSDSHLLQMILALTESNTGARLLFNRVTQTNDLQQGPKWTLIVSLKHYFWQEDIHHVTKWLVYSCSNGLHQQILAMAHYINNRVIHGADRNGPHETPELLTASAVSISARKKPHQICFI